jgi:hypothetical protein
MNPGDSPVLTRMIEDLEKYIENVLKTEIAGNTHQVMLQIHRIIGASYQKGWQDGQKFEQMNGIV